jgi:hypothetical protein
VEFRARHALLREKADRFEHGRMERSADVHKDAVNVEDNYLGLRFVFTRWRFTRSHFLC